MTWGNRSQDAEDERTTISRATIGRNRKHGYT